MKLRKNTPCDFAGICPYLAKRYSDCEEWCGEDEVNENKSSTIDYLKRYYTKEALSNISAKDEIVLIADIYERRK